MQLTEVKVSGETENEAVGGQSLITDRAITTKETLADQVALCVYVCVCVLHKNSTQVTKEKDRDRGRGRGTGRKKEDQK